MFFFLFSVTYSRDFESLTVRHNEWLQCRQGEGLSQYLNKNSVFGSRQAKCLFSVSGLALDAKVLEYMIGG